MTDSTDNARGLERIAFRKAYMSHAITSGPLMDHPDYVQYVRADLAPDPLGAVSIKPLEWERLETMPWRMRAKPMFGFEAAITDWALRAELHEQDEQHGFTLHLKGNQINTDTMQEAKAAAQADYEQRIRSALEPCDPLADPRVKALVEALTIIDALDPEGMINGCSQSALTGLVLRMGETARAALAVLSPTGGNADG